MSVEQQVDALATSVDELTGAVVTKKAALDASVVDAQSATAQAQDARTNTLSARDQAGAFKEAAYTAAQSAASAVAYQDLTALAESKDVTAVDLVIYDTAKDSDGGAWRHRCAGTSWYREPLNTATRGGRRVFPAVAVIVAEATKITIYDADDPALPMWIVLQGSYFGVPHRQGGYDYKAVAMVNGMMAYTGSNQGLLTLDFIRETSRSFHASTTRGGEYSTPIAQRGVASRFPPPGQSGFTLPSSSVNDVAMSVLPDAPIDQATGLPVPTIAVATSDGVSVINNDGTVTDGSWANVCVNVSFDDYGNLWWSRGSDFVYLSETYSADGHGSAVGRTVAFSRPFDLLTPARYLEFGSGFLAVGSNGARDDAVPGLMLHQPNYTDQSKGMSALTTSTYLTGWMPGDIKGAFLADTNDRDLVGGQRVESPDFSSDVGWTGVGNVAGELEISGGQLIARAPRSGTVHTAHTTHPGIPAGAGLKIVIDVDSYIGAGPRLAGDISITGQYINAVGETVLHSVATADRPNIGIQVRQSNEFAVNSFDVHLADADRSVRKTGLRVNGTIARAPVATGAELMAYSGFSADNYLEGTSAAYVDTLYALGWEQTNGVWGFVHGAVSAAPVDGLTIIGNTLKIAGTKPKALVRLTATTPTADQLEKIEQDERALFQKNAACTLFGASDAVKALAHDPDTRLLHVGTSDGRSVFQGLRRVANTTTPVAVAISAAGDTVIDA